MFLMGAEMEGQARIWQLLGLRVGWESVGSVSW